MSTANSPKPKLTIAVTGATGFIGSHLVPKLLRKHQRVHALVRSIEKGKIFDGTAAKIEIADVDNERDLTEALTGCDVVIHLVAIIAETAQLKFQKVIVEGTRNVVEAAKKSGVKRIIYISGLGVEQNATIGHFQAKWQAEQIIINSGLEYIIFRPSYIFGTDDFFTTDLIKKIKSGLITIYADGNYRLQPTYIDDVAELLYRASNNAMTNKIFDLGGPTPISYNELIDLIAQRLKVKTEKKYLPPSAVPPEEISPDELHILTGDYTCDSALVAKTYGIPLTNIPTMITNIINHLHE